jgi:hypothetical protein
MDAGHILSAHLKAPARADGCTASSATVTPLTTAGAVAPELWRDETKLARTIWPHESTTARNTDARMETSRTPLMQDIFPVSESSYAIAQNGKGEGHEGYH